MALGAFVYGFALSNADASILQPQAIVSDFDQLLAQLEDSEESSTAGNTASNSSADESLPAEDDQNTPHKARVLAGLLSPAHSPVEGSTTGSSTTSIGGSANTPIHSLSMTTCPNLALVGWIQGEARFALPMPPGNELLRPPQAA